MPREAEHFPNSVFALAKNTEQNIVFVAASESLSVYTIIGFIDVLTFSGGLLRVEENNWSKSFEAGRSKR